MNILDPKIFTDADFLPLNPKHQSTESIRDTLSFWQNVRRRLSKDPRAWFCAIIICAILSIIVVGPLLWNQSPAAQWLGQVSIPSSSSQTLPVWIKPKLHSFSNTEHSTQFKTLNQVDNNQHFYPSTEAVYLVWPKDNKAISYLIYRNEHKPKNSQDLGLPLAEVLPSETLYTDSLNLKPRDYWYSVVTKKLVDGTVVFSHPQTIVVKPIQVIDFFQAQVHQLIPLDTNAEAWAGKSVEIPSHPLGTDALGRDLFARLMEGGRTSLFIGIVAPLIFVSLGAFLGAISALLGGHIDNWMMRFADFIVALPFIIFMILIRITAGIQSGESGIVAMMIALILLSWPTTARLVRAQVLQLKHEPYIQSAILSGASLFYLVHRHLLPNVLGVILVTLSFAIPQAIFIEAFLSFIGLGVTPPTASWGSLCQEGLKTLLTDPRELLWPAMCIATTVLAFNLLGDVLRDALDIRMDPKL